MRICVCTKWVLYTGIPFEMDMRARTVRQKSDRAVYTVNRPDCAALELAMQLRSELGGEVVALTFGPADASQALYACLGSGADRGILVSDNGLAGADAHVAGHCLGRMIAGLDCDLVLCGARSMDFNNCQVPSILAERLDLPQLTSVIDLKVQPDGKTIRSLRRLDRGSREVVECPLPAVVAVEAAIREPHYVSVRTQQAVNDMRVHTYDSRSLFKDGTLPAPLVNEIRRSLPRPRPKKLVTPDAAATAGQRLQFIMSGGLTDKKKGSTLEGVSEEVVDELIRVLEREGVL